MSGAKDLQAQARRDLTGRVRRLRAIEDQRRAAGDERGAEQARLDRELVEGLLAELPPDDDPDLRLLPST